MLLRGSVPVLGPSNKQQNAPSFRVTEDVSKLPPRFTSHNTTKYQLVEPFQMHPKLAGISVAVLQPGEIVETHVHASMYEIFVVLEGSVSMHVTRDESSTRAHNASMDCGPGCVMVAAPREPHQFSAPVTINNPMQMLAFQIVR